MDSPAIKPASIQDEEDKKSDDKREIEAEEKEALKQKEEDGKNDTTPPAKTAPAKTAPASGGETTEEKEGGLDEGGSRKGARLNIKLPGFLRKKSRERSADKESDGEQGKDLLEKKEGDKKSLRPRMPKMLQDIKVHNPFAKKDKEKEPKPSTIELDEQAASGAEGKTAADEKDEAKEKESGGVGVARRATQLLESVRAPIVGLFARKARDNNKDKDVEAGEAGAELLESKTEDDKQREGQHQTEQVLKKETAVAAKPSKGEEEEPAIMEEVKVEGVKKDPDAASDKSTEKKDPEKDVKAVSENDGKKANGKVQFLRERLETVPRRYLYIGGLAALLFLLILIIVISVAASGGTPMPDAEAIRVRGRFVETTTSCGRIEGLVEDGAYVFRGVPYAVPPVDALRWQPSKPHNNLRHCWNGTLTTHNSTFSCWQIYRNGSYDGVEDCLTVDVFTPKVSYDSPLPVVVYIGGESLSGGESATLRPSARLARSKNVVFVYVNIRRSVLGFLALDILSKSSDPVTSGNYGLSDLVTALKWVRINIEHFGGDPRMVTLLGHQAGATLVTALTAVKEARNLTSKAWVSSGSAIYSNETLQEWERVNVAFLQKVDCTSVECLKKKTPEELLEAVPDEWRGFSHDLVSSQRSRERHSWAIIDMRLVKDQPQNEWDKGEYAFNDVPFVIGATAQVDATPDLLNFLDWNNTEQVSAYIQDRLESLPRDVVRKALERYSADHSSQWYQYSSMVSDLRTICPLLQMARKASHNFQSNVYSYLSAQRRWGPMGHISEPGSDIAAVFGVYQPTTPAEKEYVRHMQDVFYGFVRSGKFPNDYNAHRGVYLIKDDMQTSPGYPNCEFWENNGFVPQFSRID